MIGEAMKSLMGCLFSYYIKFIVIMANLPQLNKLDFKPVEFDGFEKEAGPNSFTISPKNG